MEVLLHSFKMLQPFLDLRWCVGFLGVRLIGRKSHPVGEPQMLHHKLRSGSEHSRVGNAQLIRESLAEVVEQDLAIMLTAEQIHFRDQKNATMENVLSMPLKVVE